jgi:hypothetical protein
LSIRITGFKDEHKKHAFRILDACNLWLLATFGELGHDGAKLRAKGNTEEVLTYFLSMVF